MAYPSQDKQKWKKWGAVNDYWYLDPTIIVLNLGAPFLLRHAPPRIRATLHLRRKLEDLRTPCPDFSQSIVEITGHPSDLIVGNGVSQRKWSNGGFEVCH